MSKTEASRSPTAAQLGDIRGIGEEHAAFPTLGYRQLQRLTNLGRRRSARDGEVLLEAGTADYPLLVVLKGQVRIVERQADSAGELLIALHGPGEFVGDVDMLGGRPAVFTAVAKGECELSELPRDQVREVVRADPSLGETMLQAFLVRRDLLAGTGFEGTRVIGSRWNRLTFELKELMNRNGVPHTWLDLEEDTRTEVLLRSLGVAAADTPLVIMSDGRVLRRPAVSEAAAALGLRRSVPAGGVAESDRVRDLVIVGAGPAGLAAAVYAASEGLDTLVIDAHAPGGQAGTSSKIENYLGFPMGISGGDLARRATAQAQKFGADLQAGCRALGLDPATEAGGIAHVRIDCDGPVAGRCILVASGASYRRMGLANETAFEGTGIYYSATQIEANLCQARTVIVIGGGNSAGQAAVFLSGHADRVLMLVRGDSLSGSMSRYLVERLEATENIELRYRTRVAALHGDEQLGRLEAATLATPGGDEHAEIAGIFVMIGADPRTEWVRGVLALDEKGFVFTGQTAADATRDGGMEPWPLSRPPHYVETSRPGVFAAGDVRHGSTKRVATSVGEGAMAVRFVHEALAARP